MATLVKSSDLPTLSIRLIMQGKVTEILVTPPTTFHPLASQPQPPNPTLDLGLCLVKPEVCCQLVPDNNKHPFDHFQLFSMSFMFRRYSLAVALCVFQTRDCTTCIDVQSCVRYKFTFWSPTRDNMADTFPPYNFPIIGGWEHNRQERRHCEAIPRGGRQQHKSGEIFSLTPPPSLAERGKD